MPDVVHVKSMHLSIPHYPRLVERLARVLAPGGLLVLAESEPSYVGTTLVPTLTIDVDVRRGPAPRSQAVGSGRAGGLRRAGKWVRRVLPPLTPPVDVTVPSNLLSCLSTSAVL